MWKRVPCSRTCTFYDYKYYNYIECIAPVYFVHAYNYLMQASVKLRTEAVSQLIHIIKVRYTPVASCLVRFTCVREADARKDKQ